MYKISSIIALVTLIALLPFIDSYARGGGAIRSNPGRAVSARPAARRAAVRPIQRTPAMSRAAIYSGAVGLGAAAGASTGNTTPVLVPVQESQSNQN